jgi:hypothetical protein
MLFAEFQEEEETTTMVSINPYLTVLGVLAIVTTFCFCLALVLIPLVSDYRGSLTYISNGMDDNCGWSGTVLGSCGVMIALCEIVAASHTRSPSLILVVLVQACTWCMIMGVSDTGWVFHYVVLVVFLTSTMYFHHSLCALHPFETFAYRKVNTITAVNLFLFSVAFVVEAAVPSKEEKRFALDVTVSLELTLMCCLTLQNLCVVRALNQYRSIHILFERQPRVGLAPRLERQPRVGLDPRLERQPGGGLGPKLERQPGGGLGPKLEHQPPRWFGP